MALLFVGIPESHIFIIILEVEGALSVLMVLKPLAFVFLTVREGIGALSLTLSLHVLAVIPVAVLIHGIAFSVGLTRRHFAFIFAAIGSSTRAQRYFLGRN